MSDTKKIKLRVTRRHHTFEGKTYGPGLPDGEVFTGTEKMLKAMPDRLQLASAPVDHGAASVDAAKALVELGDVKQKLADAEAELAKLKAPVAGMPSPGKKNADASNSK